MIVSEVSDRFEGLKDLYVCDVCKYPYLTTDETECKFCNQELKGGSEE